MSDVTNIDYDSRDQTRSHTKLTAIEVTSTSTSTVVSDVMRTAQRADIRGQKYSVSGDVESAVYSYIQALRAVGRTRINTADIAMALNLPLKIVERAAANLKEKGVKLIG